ncbi:MAG: thioredoxin domain-containing protein [Patescibacteria group bacterium]
MEEAPQLTGQARQAEPLTKKQRRALKKQEQREQRQGAERGRRVKTWAVWIATIAVIVLGLWWLVARSNATGSTPVPPPNEVTTEDWVKGGPNARVRIIEYSDFQCPACGAYYPIIKQITEEFGESVQFAYRHFPLRAIHPNAERAARAAEAAGSQGRFWDMHDLLFVRQSLWSNVPDPSEQFASYAEELGLSAAQFEADYSSSEVRDKIRAHENAGKRLGVAGTPTFVVNGETIQNPKSYEEFRALLVAKGAEPEAPKDDETATTTQENL